MWSVVMQGPSMEFMAHEFFSTPHQQPVLAWDQPAISHVQFTAFGPKGQKTSHVVALALQVRE